jgi:hypothetical protein
MRYDFHIAFYPFRQWPVRYQVVVCVLVLMFCSSVGVVFWKYSQAANHALRLQLDEARHSLRLFRQRLNSAHQALPNPDESSAPTASSLSTQVSEMSKRADDQGIRVNGLAITLPSTSQSLHQPAMLTTQLQGTYPSLKVWLGQNLQMYPWMAIDQMQWRLADVGSSMLDVQVSWTVYVQN